VTNHPGYLLPEGECFTEDMACALVFYPDKPEYRRALLGSIVYLSTWLAWERDSEKRGKDAARAWKNAVDETLECWTMACLEDLIANVELIRILMENKKDCCDVNVTYYPTEEPTTDIVPEIGDPPEYYGVTEITDWDDWMEHVCYNANKYVDYLVASSSQLLDAVKLSSIFLGLIAAALSLLAFSGIGLPIAFGLAATIVAGLALSATATTFLNTPGDFEDAREAIVCAIMNGYPDLGTLIEAVLESGTDWDLFYQFVDYESAVAIIYEGGYGTEYLPTETKDDCGCEVTANYIFEWDSDVDGWIGYNILTTWNVGGWIECTNASHGQWKYDNHWYWEDIETRFGLTLPIAYNQVRFKFQNNDGGGTANRYLWKFYIMNGVESLITDEYDSDDYSVNEWHEIIFNWPETLVASINVVSIRIRMYTYNHAGSERIWFDDFGVYLR
jgi:hypothetical protein